VHWRLAIYSYYILSQKAENIFEQCKHKVRQSKEQTWGQHDKCHSSWNLKYKNYNNVLSFTISFRSGPMTPTYKSTPVQRVGVQLDHRTSRSDTGYYSINTKPDSTGSIPRTGQRVTDKPNAELFAYVFIKIVIVIKTD
jgi:hypothetical protein